MDRHAAPSSVNVHDAVPLIINNVNEARLLLVSFGSIAFSVIEFT